MTSAIDDAAREPVLRRRIAQLPHDRRAELLRRLSSTQAPRWFVPVTPTQTAPSVRLFCFPYAGGGGSVYSSWGQLLPKHVEAWAVTPPGRENRAAEPPLRNIVPMVTALHEEIAPYLDVPTVFFGHSMGALVAFELARSLRNAGAPAPAAMVVAAFRAPQLPNPNIKIHHLPDEVLKTVLRKEGTPDEVVNNDALMKVLLPTLRADLELCDTYRYQPEPPLSSPLLVLGGVDDVRVGQADLAQWRPQSAGGFRLEMLPGGHFFIHSARDLVINQLARHMEDIGEEYFHDPRIRH